MASNYTGIALANFDRGQYVKRQLLFNNTAGFDASNGGAFVVASGAGVVVGGSSADVYGVIVDEVASGGSQYVDVFCGLNDKFSAIVNVGTASGSSALANNTNVYAYGTTQLGCAVANLDIVGTITDSRASISDGDRVVFTLTPSSSIPGYDSGNTA